MANITTNGLNFEYEEFGDRSNETLLLIQGLGAQMTHWPDNLGQILAKRGYHVVLFDNRDIGLSSKLDHLGPPNISKIYLSKLTIFPSAPPYTLDDMAEDSVALLTALNIDSAHIVGASMGGMIAQLVAINHPEKALSLTSIMSTSGNPWLPKPKRAVMTAMMGKPPASMDARLERSFKLARLVQSPAYAETDAELRDRLEQTAHRAHHPAGVARQMAASIAASDRRKALRKLTLPCTILHGKEDPLVRLACGVDTAKNIPNAKLEVIEGMGHDFPKALMPVFADAIIDTAQRV